MKHEEILGHPKGLFYLFFTEMWERFSYYGMRALLILYMTNYLLTDPERVSRVYGFSWVKSLLESTLGELSTQALASNIYGQYTAFVYFTPFFGGLIADQFIGQRRSVYVGGILMAIGHLLMASEQLFLFALLFLIVGNGFFKPNISSQIGGLYEQGDQRRDRAFTIFYMGINLGAFFSPFVCGTLGQKWGWHYGFSAAGIGMLIGLIVYHMGRNHLPTDHRTETQTLDAKTEPQHGKLTPDEIKKIIALVLLAALNIMFWSVFEQQGNSLQIWADRKTDWHLGSFEMPSSWLQSFNPFFIFILAPIFDRFWAWQEKRGTEPGSVAKMGIGCLIAGGGYLFMLLMLQVVPADQKSSFLWLAGATLLFTIGELYLSPIGLSLVTKIAPARLVSMMMGIWLMSSFFGNMLAGIVGGWSEKMTEANFFILLAGMAGSSGILFFVALWPLKNIVKEPVSVHQP